MFACPHCQYENPLQNRFCQRCGNPLKGLRAVITCLVASSAQPGPPLRTSPSADIATETTSTAPPPAATSAHTTSVADLLTAATYLDGDKRYQLRHPDKQQAIVSGELELEVIDAQPGIDSPITVLMRGDTEDLDPGKPLTATSLPPSAYPYLQLQEEIFPAVPELHAAWQVQAFTILVMEDRSGWRHLTKVCDSEELHPLELIHWFYEMVDLWESLETFEAEPSLLNPDNLLIDDDQILCLGRLHYRVRDRAYDLKDLGLLWQSLLRRVAMDVLADLTDLAAQISTGAVSDIEHIKETLAHLADHLQQDHPTPTTAPGDVDATTASVDTQTPPADQLQPGAAIADPTPVEDDVLLASLEEEDADNSDDSINDLPTMALPMQLYRLEDAGRTHIGRQRDHNEDFFHIETHLRRTDGPSGTTLNARGLYILCDGMGGQACGEVASMMAVETLQDYFAAHWDDEELPDEATIRNGILKANQVIFTKNESEGRKGIARMGTTLVMLLVLNNQAVVAHVGDSRLYVFTRQGLKQATVDHEVGQREINRGVEPAIAYARPDAYQLTQALGPRNDKEIAPSITPLHIGQDTLFILCSDGMSDNDLLEHHAAKHLEPLLRSRADLEEGVSNLIDLANEHNGHDNITVITVRAKVRPNLESIR